MVVLHTAAELHEALSGHEVALVPTMGALHEGHASLIRAAAKTGMTCVVSIFVNPTQFNDPADLERYPRMLEADYTFAESAGSNAVFAPSVEQMYPPGDMTRVSVGRLGEVWEGAHRPGHFEGVATVVLKLFLLVQPNIAYFGEKDWQQCVVVKRMVQDLHLPVTIALGETVRDKDGLALSSRNTQLNAEARATAPALYKAMQHIADNPESIAGKASELESLGFQVEYIAFIRSDTLEEVPRKEADRLIAAARIGGVRLIDNIAL